PGAVPEEEDVAGHALDGEVLVHRTDLEPLRLLDDVVVGGVRDGAPARDRGEARATTRAEAPVHPVGMEERRAPAASGPDAVGEHLDDRVEIVARQRAERGRAADEREQIVGRDLAGRYRRHALLREDVERTLGHVDRVELARAHGADGGGALYELVARE